MTDAFPVHNEFSLKSLLLQGAKSRWLGLLQQDMKIF